MQTQTSAAIIGERTEYALSSALARACLPQAAADEERKFAWVAGVAALFLALGIHGLLARPVLAAPAPVLVEDMVPVLYEPPPPVANTSLPPDNARPNPDQSETIPPSPVVVAVANPAEAAFAVPVEGPVLLAPARMASAPLIDLRSQVRTLKEAPQIKTF